MRKYQESKFLNWLWKDHIGSSSGARNVLSQGGEKQNDFGDFAQDIHDRLYSPGEPTSSGKDVPQWAEQLHEEASNLGDWQRLHSMCQRNSFASGIATEAVLSSLMASIPDKTREPRQGQGQGQGQGQEGEDASKVREALRRAISKAQKEVSEAEETMEGFGSMMGIGDSPNPSQADLSKIRSLYSRISGSKQIKRIAKLAGRLERLASKKKQSKVRPATGEIHGIDQGSDLSRLLPSELVQLKHPKLRLAMLARMLERRALVYGMEGREEQSQGPIILCLDESGSMEGEKGEMASAISLALLSIASKQKRAFHVIAFEAHVRREFHHEGGPLTSDAILSSLGSYTGDGTAFDPPLMRALELLRSSKMMKKADVVFVTDGISTISDPVVKDCQDITKTEGVSWYVIGVGWDFSDYTLNPIATETIHIKGGDDTEFKVGDVLGNV